MGQRNTAAPSGGGGGSRVCAVAPRTCPADEYETRPAKVTGSRAIRRDSTSRRAMAGMSGRTDFDAESLERVLAGVSYQRECVRGEGEWQPYRLPVSRGA